MIKRKDIVNDEMLKSLRAMADFNCRHWICEECPFYTFESEIGCVSLDVQEMIKKYDDGKEVLY